MSKNRRQPEPQRRVAELEDASNIPWTSSIANEQWNFGKWFNNGDAPEPEPEPEVPEVAEQWNEDCSNTQTELLGTLLGTSGGKFILFALLAKGLLWALGLRVCITKA